MAAVKEKAAKPAADLVTDAENPVYHGDSETITVADLTGGDSMMELKLGDEESATPKKSKKAEVPTEAEDEEDDDETPVTPAEDEDGEEEDSDDAEAEEEDQDAAIGKQILQKFNEDPAAAIKALYDAAPGDAQGKFIKLLTGEVADTSADFEPQSDFETALKPVYGDLKGLPQYKADVNTLFGKHANFINDAHVRLNVMDAMIAALGESAGMKFPVADITAMVKAVESGKSYADATKAFKNELSKAAKTLKQANKDRPARSGSSAGDRIVYNGSDDLKTMLKKYQASL